MNFKQGTKDEQGRVEKRPVAANGGNGLADHQHELLCVQREPHHQPILGDGVTDDECYAFVFEGDCVPKYGEHYLASLEKCGLQKMHHLVINHKNKTYTLAFVELSHYQRVAEWLRKAGVKVDERG